jgi:NAD(P)-dependent dehydrogenase (short-subunit alcohol dehydrogenase family)
MTRQRNGRWTARSIGDQSGRTAVITGANTGIGFEVAKALAERGATVVLAARDQAKAQRAAARIVQTAPKAKVSTVLLDLTSLASVRRAAGEISAQYPRLDLLVNNAGVMMTPYGQTTDGFELQLGTNHLGHFALTGLLLARLMAVPGSRVVAVSSFAHRQGRIDLADLHFERRRYSPRAAYGQSKLANLLFIYELQRQLAASGASTIAVAVEPGVVPTDLPRYAGRASRLTVRLLTSVAGQPNAAMGALATLRAATDPQVRGGEYYAPDSLAGWRGYPVLSQSSERARDIETQRLLWAESERLTGVRCTSTQLTSGDGPQATDR